ncbi:hypothetical protein [Kineosporia sp. R_H_3]|uniref:hypothetical protein n=1 Tax=Kineosporia sp. R_H_3 TaxID=1961848 RepID=UPI000B4AB784|nr:hypothetical protein [Kineosporia sp. R_H_3]
MTDDEPDNIRRLDDARARRAEGTDGVDLATIGADVADLLAGRGRHATHIREQVGRLVTCSCGLVVALR